MGHHSCCNKEYVRKGLWSPEEDLKLINHIRTNGHGCWNSVPKLAGLERCGKSCRLRWINYLRPDLKNGAFTHEEALLVIKLQQVVGNRWAQIAKHLPGRTGNKVKNFWNSSIKRKLVALQDQLTVDANVAVAVKDQANSNGSVILDPNFQMDQTIPIEPQMDHPMVIVPNVQVGHSLMNQNAQMIDHPNIVPNSQIPIPQPPPSEPPIVIQGFDGPIETIYDPKMMSYNPNMVPIPPSITVPLPDFDDLPSWPPSPYNSSLDHQNQFINQDIVLENYHMNSNPEMMQAYSQDSIMLDAAVPDMRPQTVYGAYDGVPLPLLHKDNSLARPLAPIHVPLHPNHINNVESLMTSFTSSTQYSTTFPNFASTFASDCTAAMPCAGLQCNGYFLRNPNGSSA